MSGIPGGAPSGIPGAAGTQSSSPFGDPTGSDMVIDVNLENVEAAGRLPEGKYLFRVLSMVPSRSKKGTPMWVVEAAVVEPTDFEGKKRKIYLTMQENTLWKFAEFVEATGLGKSGEQVQFKPSDAVNRLFMVDVYHEEDSRFDQLGTIEAPPAGPGAVWQPNSSGIPG